MNIFDGKKVTITRLKHSTDFTVVKTEELTSIEEMLTKKEKGKQSNQDNQEIP